MSQLPLLGRQVTVTIRKRIVATTGLRPAQVKAVMDELSTHYQRAIDKLFKTRLPRLDLGWVSLVTETTKRKPRRPTFVGSRWVVTQEIPFAQELVVLIDESLRTVYTENRVRDVL